MLSCELLLLVFPNPDVGMELLVLLIGVSLELCGAAAVAAAAVRRCRNNSPILLLEESGSDMLFFIHLNYLSIVLRLYIRLRR